MPHAVELTQVTKRFRGQTAVNQLDLAVPEGAIYGFIGPNGSGKTTTLRMILRIFQPDAGVVKVLGNEQGKAADARLGYLPEERGLYKRMKVRSLLAYYARLKGFYDCHDEIDRWLDLMGASSWHSKRIETLSKGMAQKIQFISAVIAKPQLVILDEPFSGLDPVNLESLRDAVYRLRDEGTTVIFSTHDMDMAERMCDTLTMIFRGKKVLDGTMEELQSRFPADRVKVRIEGFPADGGRNNYGELPFPHIPEVADLKFEAGYFTFRITQPERFQAVIGELSRIRKVSHFELIRPSLHDIFVGIAR